MIKFYKNRWIPFSISIILIATGFILMFVNGVSLDIEFTGGAIMKYDYTGEINPDEAAGIAQNLFNRNVTAQNQTDLASGQNRLVLNFSGKDGIEAGMQDSLDDALREAFPDANVKLWESSIVEAYLGAKFLQNSVTALILAAIAIVIYVWIRFRRIGGLSAGVMSLVALIHDVLLVLFTFTVFGVPIGDSFVAVALTIIGYSINDTIVIYDRIRENSRIYKGLPLEELVDKSINQSLTRSINTSATVTIAIIIVYAFAFANSIESIQNFALPMAVGSICGCYSTIFIAGPLWVSWQKRKSGRAAAKSKA